MGISIAEKLLKHHIMSWFEKYFLPFLCDIPCRHKHVVQVQGANILHCILKWEITMICHSDVASYVRIHIDK